MWHGVLRADTWQIPCMAVEYALYGYLCKSRRTSSPLSTTAKYGQIIHLLFSWSSFFSWLFFLCDIALIGFLSMRAYRDGNPP